MHPQRRSMRSRVTPDAVSWAQLCAHALNRCRPPAHTSLRTLAQGRGHYVAKTDFNARVLLPMSASRAKNTLALAQLSTGDIRRYDTSFPPGRKIG